MKAVIHRVNTASVNVNNSLISKIDKGLLVLIGISSDDNFSDINYIIRKILHLRIFPSKKSEFDKNIIDIVGEILFVSQFTLYANCKKGNRPSFSNAMSPNLAKSFYINFIECFKKEYSNVKDGIFGAYMKVSLENDGPVTIILDSKK